jgi:hypothetical protein
MALKEAGKTVYIFEGKEEVESVSGAGCEREIVRRYIAAKGKERRSAPFQSLCCASRIPPLLDIGRDVGRRHKTAAKASSLGGRFTGTPLDSSWKFPHTRSEGTEVTTVSTLSGT